ncbi:MAG: HipA N-terminal domain-containing protein [Candidatus Cloacimonadales bacterium]|nr:HipA N-terminal domain-containing protein [Candidatus Cloacimonadales bacterium]
MNRKALISVHKTPAAEFCELDAGFELRYLADYSKEPVSLVLPIRELKYDFAKFPSFLDGLLPEGIMLELLLKKNKLDAEDYFSQILAVGNDLVGALTIVEITE